MPAIGDNRKVRIVIRGSDFEPPAIDPSTHLSWAEAPVEEKRGYWANLANLAYKALLSQLHKGLDASGTKMPPRKRPRHDRANGPVLSPHYSDSRFQTRLRWRGTYDPLTGGVAHLWWTAAWSKIVGYHARGEVRGAPARDVVGLSAKSVEWIRTHAAKWWRSRVATRKPDLVMTASGRMEDLSRFDMSEEARESIRRSTYFTGFRRAPVARFTDADRMASLRRIFGEGGGPPVVEPAPKPKPKPKPRPRPRPAPRPKAAPPAPAPAPAPAPPVPAPEDPRITARRQTVRARLAEINARLKAGPPLSERIELEDARDRLKRYEEIRRTVPTYVPAGPIQDRINDYAEGDAKLARIIQIDDAALGEIRREIAGFDDRMNALARELIDLDRSGASIGERNKVMDRMNALGREKRSVVDRERAATKLARDHIRDAIAAKTPVTFGWSEPDPEAKSRDGDLVPPTRTTQASLDEGLAWLSGIVEAGDGVQALQLKVGEGYKYRAHMRSVKQSDPYNVQLRQDEDAPTVVHEYGHAIDEAVSLLGDRVLLRSREYLLYRAGPERRTMSLREISDGYEPGERAFTDAGFERAFAGADAGVRGVYAAKDYGSRATEIISMGLELLYTDPAGFARRDPEWCKFILGILDGSLR